MITAKRRAWLEKNKEQLKVKRKIYNAKNAEKIAAREKTYYEENKERIKEQHKEYHKTYIPSWETKENIKKYREKHKIAIAKYRAEWAKTEVGQESLRQSQSIYIGTPKGKFRKSVKDARRRSLLADQTPRLTKDDQKRIRKLLRVQQELRKDGIVMHVDHVIPLSKGGVHHPDNMQLLPMSVNLQKGDDLNFVIPSDALVVRC